MLASGMTLIFGIGGMFNFAHTAYLMLAAYGIYYFTIGLGWGNLPSIGLSVVGVILLSLLIYRFFIDKVRHRAEVVMLVTVAFALIMQEVMLSIFGNYFLSTVPLLPGVTEFLGVRVPNQYLLIIGATSAIFVILWLVLTRTKLGLALGASASDAEVACLVGIDVSKTMAISIGIATFFAAVAGVLVASVWTISPFMWLDPLLAMAVVLILGGLGSIKGSIVSAFIVALVEVVTLLLVPNGAQLKTPFVMILLMIVLMRKPEGLFGRPFESEAL
jgi:branched-chain amino acid transport system permease protein